MLALGVLAPLRAEAFGTQTIDTDLVLTDCTIVRSNDFETNWECPGYKGVPVDVLKSTPGFVVSFGLKSTAQKAAKQKLPVPNTLGPKISWRLSNRDGDWKAFATIVPYDLPQPDGKPSMHVLVVTRIEEGSTCQIAYADATADPDAETLAERAADAHGFDFDCKAGVPQKLGHFAAW